MTASSWYNHLTLVLIDYQSYFGCCTSFLMAQSQLLQHLCEQYRSPKMRNSTWLFKLFSFKHLCRTHFFLYDFSSVYNSRKSMSHTKMIFYSDLKQGLLDPQCLIEKKGCKYCEWKCFKTACVKLPWISYSRKTCNTDN